MTRCFLMCLFLLAPALGAQIVLSGTSYTQNFDSIGAGLPNGITTRTLATTTDNGFSITPILTTTPWSTATGNFYNYATATGFTGAEASGTQNASLNRSLGLRQSSAFGDAGGTTISPPCFLFVIQDTLGFTGFTLNVDLMMLSVQPRSTTWTIEYRIGTTAAFTVIGTYNDPGTFGTTPFNFNFGSVLDNQSSQVQIRVAALAASTGSGSRDSFGLDNFVLSYTAAAVPAPTITGINPVSGPAAGGTSVVITGTNFNGASSVTFGGTPATGLTITSTSITCTTPSHTAGAVDVSVTTPGGTATATNGFTFGAAPTISQVAPNFGPTVGGTSVTVTGTNLTGATGVTFGGTAGTITANTSTQVVVTTPAGTAGAVNVVVTTANGNATSTGGFTYVAAPVVASVAPPTGPDTGGTSVTISGSNLAGATSVTFDGVAATNIVALAASITCTSPSHVAGAVTVAVTTSGGTGSLTNAFTYSASGSPILSLREGPGGPQLSDGAPVSTGGYRDFGALDVSAAGVPKTFVIQNNGSASLTVSGVQLGAASADFSVSAVGLPVVIPGAMTYTFSVTFDPASAGTKSATITINHNDSAATNPFSMNVSGRGIALNATIAINTPTPLPDATVGVNYAAVTLAATGGAAPYAYTLIGGTLPFGMTLSQSGVLGGTPGAGALPGLYSFTVRALDTTNGYNNKAFSLTLRSSTLVGGGSTQGDGGGGCSSAEGQFAWLLLLAAMLGLRVTARRKTGAG